MHFLNPPSCGDGIKALLSLFDFQHPPITAGHWLIIVPLQSLGMALLTPPTAGLPLKVMVTASNRNPWSQNYLLQQDWPTFWLPELRRSLVFPHEAGDRDWRNPWISLKLGLFIGPQCMNVFKLAAPEPEQCSPSEVRVDRYMFFIIYFLIVSNFSFHFSVNVIMHSVQNLSQIMAIMILFHFLDLKPNFSGPPPSSMAAGPDAYLQGNIRITLEDPELWKTFHEIGTEMIITKPGR